MFSPVSGFLHGFGGGVILPTTLPKPIPVGSKATLHLHSMQQETKPSETSLMTACSMRWAHHPQWPDNSPRPCSQSPAKPLTLMGTQECEQSSSCSSRIKQASTARLGLELTCMLVHSHQAHSTSSARVRRASCSATLARSAALSSLT